jgi:glucosylceramidase
MSTTAGAFDNETLVELSLRDPKAGKYVKGVGFQWVGKRTIPFLHHLYPELRLIRRLGNVGFIAESGDLAWPSRLT